MVGYFYSLVGHAVLVRIGQFDSRGRSLVIYQRSLSIPLYICTHTYIYIYVCICILLLFNIRRSGWSPLLLAAKNGHLDLVKIFLDNNARVDVFDQVGNFIDHVLTSLIPLMTSLIFLVT